MNADEQSQLRRRFVAACKARERSIAKLMKAGMSEPLASLAVPNFDFEPFLDLKCGATGKRTRLPCPHTNLYANGRCRWHGGLSTGPRSAEGKSRSARNVQRRWSCLPTEGDDDSAGGLAACPRASTNPMSNGTSGSGSELLTVEAAAGQAPTPKPHEVFMNVGVRRIDPLPESVPEVPRKARSTSPFGRTRAALESAGPGGLSVIRIALLTGQSIATVESSINLMKRMGLLEAIEKGELSSGALRVRIRAR
jgi:hypothetical protein